MEIRMTFDHAYAAVAEEVRAARDALVRVAGAQKNEWWYPADLRMQARNGWSAGAMGVALDGLVDDGVFEVSPDLCVRLRG
jgi:hypothetical protein